MWRRPVVIVGFFGRDYIAVYLRDIELLPGDDRVGIYWVSDHVGMTVRQIEHLSLWDALFRWAAILALIPGTSRSGML